MLDSSDAASLQLCAALERLYIAYRIILIPSSFDAVLDYLVVHVTRFSSPTAALSCIRAATQLSAALSCRRAAFGAPQQLNTAEELPLTAPHQLNTAEELQLAAPYQLNTAEELRLAAPLQCPCGSDAA